MPHCAVLSCKNSTRNVSRDKGNVSFHRFPTDPNVKEKWIEATGQKDWFPTKHSRICSIHFNDWSFTETKKFRRLTKEAIPSIDILKTSTYDEDSRLTLGFHDSQEIHQASTSNKDTLFNPPKIKLAHKLNLAQQKIKEQNKLIKRLREQNRRKGQKIFTLVSLIVSLKKKCSTSDGQANVLNTTNVTTK